MDNLTHTLIGVTVAHALPKKYRKPQIYWASVIGNNLPDSDFIHRIWPGTSDLDYLVHHRGYTHSFFLMFGLAVFGAALASFLGNPKGKRQVTRETYLFTLLGCFLHIGADFMNSYGVHPFSPFYNQWFYGDFLFIIEPWIWMILLPFASMLAIRKSAKVFWGTLFAAGLALIWFVPYITLPFKILTTLAGIASFWIHHHRKNALFAVASVLVIIGCFSSVSWMVKNQLQNSALAPFADIELTPEPANPFCWSSWSKKESEKDYVMRSAVIAPFPSILSTENCTLWKNVNPDAAAPTAIDESDPASPTVLWKYEIRLKKSVYQQVFDHSCKFQRLMSFLRFPYLVQSQEGVWRTGDLRYENSIRKNFTGMEIQTESQQVKCETGNAPWISPFI